MSLQTTSQEKPFDNFVTAIREAHPEASTRDIAVVFTDVVGSTKYFKKYGDRKGREMLRKHHSLATSIVEEYGGSLIKEVGDSVMVYFPDVYNAVRAAIKMQHRFRSHNRDVSSRDKIRIRVGIHFGKVIIEEKDIYGDVVNVSAKITNLADGDQIFISKEVHDLVKELPAINFELMNFWGTKEVPTGLTIYKIIWETAPVSQPDRRVVLCVRSHNNEQDDNKAFWNSFLSVKDHFFQSKHESEKILSSSSIMLTYKEASTAFSIAEDLLEHFNSRISEDSHNTKASIYLVLTHDINLAKKNLDDALSGIAPRDIWVTKEVYRDLKKNKSLQVNPSPEDNLNHPFYCCITEKVSNKEKHHVSDKTKSSIGVIYEPCFYCGSRNHKPADCPSKNITDTSNYLGKLGYLSSAQITDLLGWYLSEQSTSIGMPSKISMQPQSMVGPVAPPDPIECTIGSTHGMEIISGAMCDSKNIYQLRFLRSIWASRENDWEKAKKVKSSNEGGYAWLALDSLRVSHHEKADAFLKTALEKDAKDFRAMIISGFSSIEKNDLRKACEDFEKALPLAKINPHKIYIYLLQARVYALLGDAYKADECIQKILVIDPMCSEAVYQDILIKAREGRDASAIQRLMKLINQSKNYYPLVMIDTEMAPFSNLFSAALNNIMEGARATALQYTDDAKTSYGNNSSIITEENQEEVRSFLEKINVMMDLESYFGYLDVPIYADKIINICNNALRLQKRDLAETLYVINKRIDKNIDVARSIRFPRMTSSLLRKLKFLKSKTSEIGITNDLFSSRQFDVCRKDCDKITRVLISLESGLARICLMERIAVRFMRFMKYSSMFFSIVFFLGIFVFPLFANPSVLAWFDISSKANLWPLQRMFLVVGGVVSMIGSLFLVLRGIGKEKTFSNRGR